jgi:hypothetical protein
MAKDPACLFYWGDWAGGTATFSRHLKGCYMDLLNAQFNNGPLSLDEVKTVLGSDFGPSWPTLQKKFNTTADGHFFNARLQAEKDKRSSYVKSRRKNLEPHMDSHMDNGNENRIENGLGKEGAGRKPLASKLTAPQGSDTNALHLNWEEWGTMIVDKLDPYWGHGDRSRVISRQEMDAFLSVAIRNNWNMPDQERFRRILKGFDWKKTSNGKEAKAKAFDL